MSEVVWPSEASAYLEARNLTTEDAERSGLRPIDKRTAYNIGFRPAGSGLVIPCLDPFSGDVLETKWIRYFDPPIIEGIPRRYMQLPGTPVEVLLDPDLRWKRIAKDVSIDLLITEGAVKAIAANRQGHHCIAISGVDCWHLKGSKELTPLLQKIKWRGRRVFIAYDSDAVLKTGVQAAEQQLAAALGAAGATVRLLRIPPRKVDLNDLLLQTDGPKALKRLIREAMPAGTMDGNPLMMEVLSSVEAKAVDWLWDGYLPNGMLAMLSGDPNAAKTFIALSIAADLSNGFVPSSKKKCKPINTIYMSHENSPEYVVRPRFEAAGGNAKRLFIIKETVTLQDIGRIEASVREKKAGLLIVDPLQSFLGADVDAHRSNETRPVMDGLVRLAEQNNISVLILRHLAKSSGGRAIHRGLGSIDLTAAVRSEMIVGHAPETPQQRAMVQIKNSVGMHAPSLAFEIVPKGISAKLEWRGESSLTAADLLAPEGVAKRKTQLDEAREYLSAALKAGPRLVHELEAEAPVPLRVLQEASKRMMLRKTREGKGGAWRWALPSYAVGGRNK